MNEFFLLRLMWSLNALDAVPFAMFWHFIDRIEKSALIYFRYAVSCFWKHIFVADRASWRANKHMKNKRWFWRSETFVELVLRMMYGEKSIDMYSVNVQHPSIHSLSHTFGFIRTCTLYMRAVMVMARCTTVFRLYLISKLIYECLQTER